MVDLRLPTPLLDPSKWPVAENSLYSIFALSWGGPLLERMNKEKANIVFELPLGFWKKLTQASRAVVEDRLEHFPDAVLRDESAPYAPLRMLDWALAVFPQTALKLGDFQFRKLLEKYVKQMEPEFATLDSLRFFPGLLKREKDLPRGIESLAATELARVTVLFSPQTEISSDSARDADASGSLIIYNPTVEMVEHYRASEDGLSSAERSLVAIWRYDDTLHETTLDWQEGAVFDELRENPRTDLQELLFELNQTAFPLTATRPFADVIESLIARKLLLRRA